VSCRLARIPHRWDSATLSELPGGETIGFSEMADVRLELDRPSAADPIGHCPQTGRFMLCDKGGRAVALGVIDSMTTADHEGTDRR
jgi:sulfate adenylyltransferase subunit 1 (EFTu-like GTPase family)